jgi:hypothetical protein
MAAIWISIAKHRVFLFFKLALKKQKKTPVLDLTDRTKIEKFATKFSA